MLNSPRHLFFRNRCVRSYRGILTIVTLAALLGVAVIVTAALFYPQLPDPAVADRDGLLRWLVARDLSAESAETRRTLARRLEEEFQTGLDFDAAEGLSPPQRKQLWDNILVLLEPWFIEKTERYFQLAAAQRTAYLDQVIDTITVWRGADSLRLTQTDGPGARPGPGGLLAALLGQVEQWKQRAGPQRRQQMQQLLLAVQMRWLMRGFEQVSPPLE